MLSEPKHGDVERWRMNASLSAMPLALSAIIKKVHREITSSIQLAEQSSHRLLRCSRKKFPKSPWKLHEISISSCVGLFANVSATVGCVFASHFATILGSHSWKTASRASLTLNSRPRSFTRDSVYRARVLKSHFPKYPVRHRNDFMPFRHCLVLIH